MWLLEALANTASSEVITDGAQPASHKDFTTSRKTDLERLFLVAKLFANRIGYKFDNLFKNLHISFEEVVIELRDK